MMRCRDNGIPLASRPRERQWERPSTPWAWIAWSTAMAQD
jgi:hypothetical protein